MSDMLGSCCLTVLAATSLSFWWGKPYPSSSWNRKPEKQILCFGVETVSTSEQVCGSIGPAPRSYWLARERPLVRREPRGLTECLEVFWQGCRVECSLLYLPPSVGTTVSLETTNSLLDLLCFYGDGESTSEKEDEKKEDLEEPEVWKICWSLFFFHTYQECIEAMSCDCLPGRWCEASWMHLTFPRDAAVVTALCLTYSQKQFL